MARKQPGVRAPEGWRFTYRRMRRTDVCAFCRMPIEWPDYFWLSAGGTIRVCQLCALVRWPA